jgi:hypothetical protein
MSISRHILVVMLAACGESPSFVVEPGVLECCGVDVTMSLPASAAGEPFVVRVATLGDGCYRFERTDVEVTPDAANISPFDRRVLGMPCPLILASIPHEVSFAFDTSGMKMFYIHGRREVIDGHEDVVYARSVVVE